MGQYLSYIAESAGLVKPRFILLVTTGTPWVDRQVRSDVAFAFPEAQVRVVDMPEPTMFANLVVLPFVDSFASQYVAKGVATWRYPGCQSDWIMLYGVGQREVHVLPSRCLWHYYIMSRVVAMGAALLRRVRLGRVSRRLAVAVFVRL